MNNNRFNFRCFLMYMKKMIKLFDHSIDKEEELVISARDMSWQG